MTSIEANAVIQNALQFLGPLTELGKVLAEAAQHEKYLKESGPRIIRARQEFEGAAAALAKVQADLDTERQRLAVLLRDGEADLRQRIASVEAQVGSDLTRKYAGLREEIEGLEDQSKRLMDEITGLQREYGSVLAEVGALKQERSEVRRDLAKIAERAGGS